MDSPSSYKGTPDSLRFPPLADIGAASPLSPTFPALGTPMAAPQEVVILEPSRRGMPRSNALRVTSYMSTISSASEHADQTTSMIPHDERENYPDLSLSPRPLFSRGPSGQIRQVSEGSEEPLANTAGAGNRAQDPRLAEYSDTRDRASMQASKMFASSPDMLESSPISPSATDIIQPSNSSHYTARTPLRRRSIKNSSPFFHSTRNSPLRDPQEADALSQWDEVSYAGAATSGFQQKPLWPLSEGDGSSPISPISPSSTDGSRNLVLRRDRDQSASAGASGRISPSSHRYSRSLSTAHQHNLYRAAPVEPADQIRVPRNRPRNAPPTHIRTRTDDSAWTTTTSSNSTSRSRQDSGPAPSFRRQSSPVLPSHFPMPTATSSEQNWHSHHPHQRIVEDAEDELADAHTADRDRNSSSTSGETGQTGETSGTVQHHPRRARPRPALNLASFPAPPGGPNPASAAHAPTTTSPPHHNPAANASSSRSGAVILAYRSRIPSDWSPHLWPSAVRSRRSLFHAPSMSGASPGRWLPPSRRNLQLACFVLGFVLPLAWLAGAVWPLPKAAAELGEKGRLGAVDWGGDEGRAAGAVRRFESARWWRNVNRAMSAVGVAVCVLLVTLGVVSARGGAAG